MLAASEQQYLQGIAHQPSKLGSIPTLSGPSHPKHGTSKPASQQRPDNHSINKTPHQPQVEQERAKEAGFLTQAERNQVQRRSEQQQKQPSQAQHRFWNTLKQINDSKTVKVINAVGDTITDALNPISSANKAWNASKHAAHPFGTGHWGAGLLSTGEVALEAALVILIAKLAFKGGKLGLKGVSTASSKLGFFGNKSVAVEIVDEIIAPAKHPLAGLSKDNIIRAVEELGLEVERDNLVLWSGLGRYGVEKSKAYVSQYGGKTLELTPGGAWLNNMDLFNNPGKLSVEEVGEIWESVSKSLGRQAKGQVRALLGQVRPKSIYNQELSELRVNPNVTGIYEIQLLPRFETVLKTMR